MMLWTLYSKAEAADLLIDLIKEETKRVSLSSELMDKLEAYKDEFFPTFLADGSVRVPLTQGQFAYVDAQDWPKASRHKWYATFDGWHWYARAKIAGKVVPLHRFIMDHLPAKTLVDHEDRDGLNNRRKNLREACNGRNMRNRAGWHRKADNGYPKSKYKGVYFHADSFRKGKKKLWRSVIKLDGKIHNVGTFLTEEEAALAYNVKAIELHGEFAYLNVIPNGTNDDPRATDPETLSGSRHGLLPHAG